MKLNDYLNANPGSGSRLAADLGVNPVMVTQWRHGKKRVPAERCPEIERATSGKVTCEELRPDLSGEWAYLRESKRRAA
jgi:DNA-binding transcriptional regulator YdaS (Cro superfamily)